MLVENKFPDNLKLAETRVLIRRTDDKNLNKALKQWLDNMTETGCMRDQLSIRTQYVET